MRRVLRWLWRQCWKAVLTGLLLICGAMSAVAIPTIARDSKQLIGIPHQLIQCSTYTVMPSADAGSPADQQRARERSRRARVLFLISYAYQGILLAGFFMLGGSRWLARIVARFGGRWLLALAAVLGIFAIAGLLLTFPLDYYSGFTFQHQYGLSNQSTWQWLRDYLLANGVSLLLGFPMAMLGYAILRRAPRTWWLWLTAASVPLSIFFMLIEPVFIAPLFNTFTPLRDVELRQQILAMAHQQGIQANDVFQVDASRQSNAVNAYVNGFGPTQRIVLYDTLLKNFSHEEIQYIMAHEMGHYVLGHIRQGIFFAIFGTLIGSFALYLVTQHLLARFGDRLGYTTLGNPASYPLLIALSMLGSLIAMPIGNAVSRHFEWQADRFAAQVYPHPAVGISSFHKLARINVSDEDPPRWVIIFFGTHPSIAERIHALEQVQQGKPFPPIP